MSSAARTSSAARASSSAARASSSVKEEGDLPEVAGTDDANSAAENSESDDISVLRVGWVRGCRGWVSSGMARGGGGGEMPLLSVHTEGKYNAIKL